MSKQPPMRRIILTAEQAEVLAEANGSVAICRPDGSIAGLVSSKTRILVPDDCPFTPEEVAVALRDADPTRRMTTEEVLKRLRAHE